MRRLVVLSVLVTALPWGFVSASAAAATECQGQAATIVGEPGARVDGTDGPDVIVTNGAEIVHAGDGADLVCTTAMPDVSWVYAGADDDSVVAGGNGYERLRVDLGAGSDRFDGGAGKDIVKTYDPFGEPSRTDEVSTGRGNDVVKATRPIGPATDDADRIDLGPGRDVLALGDSGLADAALVNGGPGEDRISINSDDEGTDVVIDTDARTIERGGPYLTDWVSFHDYFVKEFGAVVTFEGSSRAERLQIYAAARSIAHMGGGDDVATLSSVDRAELTGGRGSDMLRGSGGPDVLLGGAGRDQAVGRKGRDRCVAEIERGCER